LAEGRCFGGALCVVGAGEVCFAAAIPISWTGALFVGVELAAARYFSGEAANFVAQFWQQK